MLIKLSPSRRSLKLVPHESPSRQTLKFAPHEDSPSTSLNIRKSSYIPDSLYRTYTAHKDKNNIDVEFVMEQASQQ